MLLPPRELVDETVAHESREADPAKASDLGCGLLKVLWHANGNRGRFSVRKESLNLRFRGAPLEKVSVLHNRPCPIKAINMHAFYHQVGDDTHSMTAQASAATANH